MPPKERTHWRRGTPSRFLRRIHGKHWNLKPVSNWLACISVEFFDAVLTRFLLQLNREVRLEVRLARL
jgi:hypothetical protein